MKISNKLSITIVVLIISIILIYFFTKPDKQEVTENTTSENVNYNQLDEIIFKVKTKPVIKGELVQKISANGIVKAAKELEITSNINGIINQINVYEGKYVSKDELLISMDDREYRINLREAQEKIIEAKVNYGLLIKDLPSDTLKSKEQKQIEKQLIELEKKYNASEITEENYLKKKEDLDMKLIFTGAKREELILNKSGYNAALNQIERAKLNLEYTKIKAPFSGAIGNFDLVTGQRITGGQKLFKIFNMNTMKIDINILENELEKIKIGNNVKIEVPALNNENFVGTVTAISPYIDKDERTCKVVVSIKNKGSKLKSGMFAKVLIDSKTFKDQILIPKEALLVRDKRNLVFIVENSLAKWKYVDIGEENEKYISILKGVEEGESVIVEGQFNLAHDSKVKVIN